MDPDGDSEMLSSPESEKFGSGPNGPRTPRAPSGLTEQYPASELSPPGSQDVQSSKQQKQPQRQQQQETGEDGLGAASAAFANSRKGIEGKDTEAVNTPGASWMNKRAEEEYQRAMEYVVDRDFSLEEFGDPYDEREMSQTGA